VNLELLVEVLGYERINERESIVAMNANDEEQN
jgi:hypothetical protein